MASAASSESSIEYRSKRQTAKACKRRRNQNTEIEELGELLPFRPDTSKSLDKLSVLRLTTSYIRFHNFMKSAYGNDSVSGKRVFADTIANSVDGFLLVLDGRGTVLFAGDGMLRQVGLDPKDVIGHSINDIIESEDAETIRENLKPQGTERSQPRSFCVRLKSEVGSGRRATSRFNTHMMVQVSGNLKVDLLPPSSSSSSSSSSSPSTNNGGELEVLPRQPKALGLIVECRLIETSPSILELNTPHVCISVTAAPPHGRILSVDEKISEALGFDPFHVVGSIIKDYIHPADSTAIYPYKLFFILKGHVITPSFRFLSSSGHWVSVQIEARRLNNVGSKLETVGEIKIWILRSSDSSPYLRPSTLPHNILSLPLSFLERLFNSAPFSLPPPSSQEAVTVGERVHLKQPEEVNSLMELEKALHLCSKFVSVRGLSCSSSSSSSFVGSESSPSQSALPLPSPSPSLPSQPPSVASAHSSSTSDSTPSTSPHCMASSLSPTPSSSNSITNSPQSIPNNILRPSSFIHSQCSSIEGRGNFMHSQFDSIEGPSSSIHSYPHSIEGPSSSIYSYPHSIKGPSSSIHSYPDSITGPTSTTANSVKTGVVDSCTEYTEKTTRPADTVSTTTVDQFPLRTVCSPEFHSVPEEPAFHSAAPIPASLHCYPPPSSTIPPSFQFGTQQKQHRQQQCQKQHQQHHQQQRHQQQQHQQHHQQHHPQHHQQLLFGAGATKTEDDLELLFREFAEQQEPSQQQQFLLQQQQLQQQIQQQQQILQQLLKLQEQQQSLLQQPDCPATRAQVFSVHAPFSTFTC